MALSAAEESRNFGPDMVIICDRGNVESANDIGGLSASCAGIMFGVRRFAKEYLPKAEKQRHSGAMFERLEDRQGAGEWFAIISSLLHTLRIDCASLPNGSIAASSAG